MSYTLLFFLLSVFLALIFSGLFIVKQQTSVVLERFGKYLVTRKPGLHIKIPFVDKIAGKISLKILQLDVSVETKTKDDVFVKLKLYVQ